MEAGGQIQPSSDGVGAESAGELAVPAPSWRIQGASQERGQRLPEGRGRHTHPRTHALLPGAAGVLSSPWNTPLRGSKAVARCLIPAHHGPVALGGCFSKL